LLLQPDSSRSNDDDFDDDSDDVDDDVEDTEDEDEDEDDSEDDSRAAGPPPAVTLAKQPATNARN